VVTPAGAAERLTDVDYMNAARCAGLAEGAKLDTASVTKLLGEQGRGRDFYIRDEATSKRQDASRWAYRAKAHDERSLGDALNGCKDYLGPPTAVATASAAR
jgi:hypothetical protein